MNNNNTTTEKPGISRNIICITPPPLANAVLTAASKIKSIVCGDYRSEDGNEQNITDSECLRILADTSFQCIKIFFKGKLVEEAQQGRIFSVSETMIASLITYSTVCLNAVVFGFDTANLIEILMKKTMTAMPFVNITISAFFFYQTVSQLKNATKTISQAQELRINKVLCSISQEDVQNTFKQFLLENNSNRSITDKSKIIRTVNQMNNPSKFFKAVGPNETIKIDDCTGQTVLVSDRHSHTNRLNPNEYKGFHSTQTESKRIYLRPVVKIWLYECYNKSLELVELNGVKIFEKLSDRQMNEINKKFCLTKRSSPDSVLTAHTIAETIGCSSSDELMDIIEIVIKEVQGKKDNDLWDSLSHIKSGPGHDAFVNNLRTDLNQAIEINKRGGLNFENPLTAVYHFRKHMQDFPDDVKYFGNTLETYLGSVKNRLFDDSNLREVCTLQNGIVTKTYVNDSNELAIITSLHPKAKISSMYVCDEYDKYNEYNKRLENFFENYDDTAPPKPVSHVAYDLGKYLGFRFIHILIVLAAKVTY